MEELLSLSFKIINHKQILIIRKNNTTIPKKTFENPKNGFFSGIDLKIPHTSDIPKITFKIFLEYFGVFKISLNMKVGALKFEKTTNQSRNFEI